MSEINNDSVEAPVEKIEEPTPAVEEKPEVVETSAVEEKIEEVPVVEKKAKKESKAPVADDALVALFSKRNLNWSEVGKLVAGYNLVSKNDADKWLTINGVRLATPEEVASKVAK